VERRPLHLPLLRPRLGWNEAKAVSSLVEHRQSRALGLRARVNGAIQGCGAAQTPLAAPELGLIPPRVWRGQGSGQHMAGHADTIILPDLTPVAAEAKAAEGDPRPVYTWAGPSWVKMGMVRSYTAAGGGDPRLVAVLGVGVSLGVWDTGTGAFLGALPCPSAPGDIFSLVTYQLASDGRSRVAACSGGGHLSIWDGDDFRLLHALMASADARTVYCLAVYEEPISGSTRLVSG
jgi:hypothetical protein